MYNYHIFIILYAAWVVLGAAATLAVILGRAFETTLEPPPAEPPQSVGTATTKPILDYARPVVKQSAYRKRPWLAGCNALIHVIVLISISAVPIIAIWLASGMLFMYALPAMVATSIAIIAAAIVIWRALKRQEGKPAAAFWPGRKLLITSLCGIPILLLVLFLLYLSTKHRLQQLRAEMDMQSLSLFQPVPDGMPNAADKYRQAFAVIDAADPKLLEWPRRSADWSSPPIAPPELPENLNGAVLILREASQVPTADWGVNPTSYTVTTSAVPLSSLRRAAILLSIHASREANLGHLDVAVRDIHAIRMMAKNCLQPQTLVEGLVCMGIEAVANGASENVLPLAGDEQQLTQLAPVSDDGSRNTAINMLRGEQAASLRTLAAIYGGSRLRPLAPVQTKAAAFPLVLMSVFTADLDTQSLRRFFDDAIACVAETPKDTLDRSRRLDAGTTAYRQQAGILSSILMPSIARAVQKTVELDMQRQLLNLGIAARQFYLRKGHLPGSLDELVSARLIEHVPTDVFDGRPVRMKVNKNEIVIYSVGADGRDNGGDYTVNKDITFRVGIKPLWEIDLANMPPREEIPESSR